MRETRTSLDVAVSHLLRLRRVERLVEPELREDIAQVREFVEAQIGPTVKPAQAARLLGVSQPALARWIDNDEIAVILTPEGRREVPLPELLGLLEDVELLDAETSPRPLERVIRERRRRAVERVDLDRYFPREPRGHRGAEVQALMYHRVLADNLDDHVIATARRRLRRWQDESRIHPHWADEWEAVLSLSNDGIAEAISADDPRGSGLRQTSPFAGALTQQERRRLREAVEERL